MHERATPEAMRLRRSTVEHPFATLKYRIFAHPRFLLRGRNGAQTEMSLAVLAYNLKRNVLGGRRFSLALATSWGLNNYPVLERYSKLPQSKSGAPDSEHRFLSAYPPASFVTICTPGLFCFHSKNRLHQHLLIGDVVQPTWCRYR